MQIQYNSQGALRDLEVYGTFFEDLSFDLNQNEEIKIDKINQDIDQLLAQNTLFLPIYIKNIPKEGLLNEADYVCEQVIHKILEFVHKLGLCSHKLQNSPSVLRYLATLAQINSYYDIFGLLYQSRIAKLINSKNISDLRYHVNNDEDLFDYLNFLNNTYIGIPTKEQAKKIDHILGKMDSNKYVFDLVEDYYSEITRFPKTDFDGQPPRIGVL